MNIFAILAAVSTISPRTQAKPVKNVPPLTAEGLPNIRSESAFVVDIETGELIFAKAPDQARGIASTGKIFVAMAVRKLEIELDEETEILDSDRLAAAGGARSRLAVGWRFKNRDLLAAMLVGSDNRAATALGRAVGLDASGLTEAMREIAASMGLKNTSFAGPSGLKGNQSTAREMAVALTEALRDPVIARLLSSKRHEIPLSPPIRKQSTLTYYNTNELLHREPEVVGGKTGFTTDAGYCLVMAAKVKKHKIAVAFLGADGKKTRFADYRRLRMWLESR